MNLISRQWAMTQGKPVIVQKDDSAELLAMHRRPSSGEHEPRAVQAAGIIGALAFLLNEYGPETHYDEAANILLEAGEFVVVGLLNAVERLVAVAEAETLDVPLESLRGWFFAGLWLTGAWIIRSSFLIDMLGWAMNREKVRIGVCDKELSIRHGLLRPPRRIKRRTYRSVEIISKPFGNEVVILHDGGVLRVASIYGEKSRALLFKMRLEDLLAEACETTEDEAHSAILEKLDGPSPSRLVH